MYTSVYISEKYHINYKLNTGSLKMTHTNRLSVFAGIAPSDIRRAVVSRAERTRPTTDHKAPTQWTYQSGARLKSRKSFITCTGPITTTAKAARLELWKERLGPWTPLCTLTSVLTNTSQLAQRTPGQPGRHSAGCVHRLVGQERTC